MDADKKRLHMAVIAGAAYAARFKEKHPRATEQDIIQDATDNAENILNKIDDPL